MESFCLCLQVLTRVEQHALKAMKKATKANKSEDKEPEAFESEAAAKPSGKSKGCGPKKKPVAKGAPKPKACVSKKRAMLRRMARSRSFSTVPSEVASELGSFEPVMAKEAAKAPGKSKKKKITKRKAAAEEAAVEPDNGEVANEVVNDGVPAKKPRVGPK